jgi:hypothetical protein
MKIIKFFLGLLLLPLCVSVSQTIWHLIISIQPNGDALLPVPALALLLGLGLWLVMYYTMPHPVRSYILAHELTHAIWGALMGAEIFDINIEDDRGFVTMSKTNFLITLAPYFFPFYTVIIIACYYGLSIFFNVARYNLFWLAAIGFTWGFHLTFTISALLQHQTDIQQHGKIFSYTIIYLFNVIGICFWIIMVSPATLEAMINQLHDNTITTATITYDTSCKAIDFIKNKLPSHN